ncbi:MAG: type II secretion system F family protein [Campylobacter sp.]|nr:type II secretion system F family protein [Campylobacter sp.]
MKKSKRIKFLTRSITSNSDLYDAFTKRENATSILENQDKFLLFIKKFDENIVLKIISFVLVFFTVYLFVNISDIEIESENLAILAICILIFFIVAPGIVRRVVVENRIRNISVNIPIFVDLLAVCVQAGMDTQAAIAFLQDSISETNKDFAPFLNRLLLKSEVSGMDEALLDLSREIPSVEVSMMCTTLRQSLKYGSAIYESLTSLSMEIRELELLRTEEAIGQLSAKMSVPLILFFMFPVIIIIAAPGVMKILGGF